MNSYREEFLSQYEHQTLSGVELPEPISGLFAIEACLKDTAEKQTFLLRARSGGTPVLLKRATRYSRYELKNEYDVLMALDNACLPKAKGFYDDGIYAYMVREYIQGESLYDLIERHGPLEERKAVEIASCVCGCLSYLHRRMPPVIHRDVKPQNVIRASDGRLVLIDLGTARLYKQDAVQDTVFMGTFATAAPEQYGFGQTDARCDIYAAGMLLIYLLTADFRTDAKALGGIPKPLRSILTKCIEFDPKRRFGSAQALKTALRRFSLRRVHRVAAGVAAGVCTAAALTVFFLLHGAAVRQQALAVQFVSPLIEQAVRQELGKKAGEPILAAELASVEELAICGDQVISNLTLYQPYSDQYNLDGKMITSTGDIASLEDLRPMKNLRTLVLDRQNITDISPLRGLPLQRLALSKNQITDLSPIKQCTGLAELSVSANPLSGVGPIASFVHLEALDISFTAITDISAIGRLPLRKLSMFEVPLADYMPLKQLRRLETLDTRFVPLKGVRVIGTMTGLKSLAVLCCDIKDLKELSALTGLEELNLNSNPIEDLSPVDSFPRLRFIDICYTPVKSLEPLKKLPSLSSVNLSNSSVPDLATLLELPGVQYVLADRAQAQTLHELASDLPFRMDVQ